MIQIDMDMPENCFKCPLYQQDGTCKILNIWNVVATEGRLGDCPLKEVPQEPMLDKIRAEMLEEMLSHSGTGEEVIQAYVDGLKKGLDILDKHKADKEYEAKVITRGNCMMCGKELTEGLFFCKECEAKAVQGRK